jgi:hypothetical protein
MNKPTELLPCPFCKGQAARAHDITLAWIECIYGCGANSGKVSRHYPERAEKLWNTRALTTDTTGD